MMLTAPKLEKVLVPNVNSLFPLASSFIESSIDSSNVAQAFRYTLEQLTSIPDESHMGLSCGNPVAAASIKPVMTWFIIGLVNSSPQRFL
jgi:arsenite methyltransferase